MIRVVLPFHLRNLARVTGEVLLDVPQPATQRTLLDALEAAYPMLRGTIREHGTLERRAYLRYFICERDASFDAPDDVLPEAVQRGEEPFMVVGAMSGG